MGGTNRPSLATDARLVRLDCTRIEQEKTAISLRIESECQEQVQRRRETSVPSMCRASFFSATPATLKSLGVLPPSFMVGEAATRRVLLAQPTLSPSLKQNLSSTPLGPGEILFLPHRLPGEPEGVDGLSLSFSVRVRSVSLSRRVAIRLERHRRRISFICRKFVLRREVAFLLQSFLEGAVTSRVRARAACDVPLGRPEPQLGAMSGGESWGPGGSFLPPARQDEGGQSRQRGPQCDPPSGTAHPQFHVLLGFPRLA